MPHPALLRRALLLIALVAAPLLRAAEEADIAAVRAADDERVAAILAADAARLGAIFSDDLHYTHSNGHHDTKKSYTASLVTKKTVYRLYEYKERDFALASPDVALMRAHVLIQSANGGNPVVNDLSVLAVFRKEGGKWRFLAWQSAKLPAPAAK